MSVIGSLKFRKFFLFAPENSILRILVLDISGDKPQTITFLLESNDINDTELRLTLEKGSVSNLPIEDFADKKSMLFLKIDQILVREVALQVAVEIIVRGQSIQIDGNDVICTIEKCSEEGAILVNLNEEHTLQL